MQSLLALLLVVLLALLAARVWIRIRKRKGPVSVSLPGYSARESILSPAERAYLEVLQQILGEAYIIFPKVSLGQILDFPGARREHRVHWTRVQRRAVDLLVCSRELSPVLAIKFKPEYRSKKGGGDPLSDSLDVANVPLLRVKPAKDYDIDKVAYRIKLTLARLDSELSDEASITTETDFGDVDSEVSQLSTIRRWTSGLWATATRSN
jgi:hypothetical protein